MTARAELSAVTTAIEELSARVGTLLEGLEGAERAAWATDLTEVERSLDAARRRLGRLSEGRR